jgi:hypothetical protein
LRWRSHGSDASHGGRGRRQRRGPSGPGLRYSGYINRAPPRLEEENHGRRLATWRAQTPSSRTRRGQAIHTLTHHGNVRLHRVPLLPGILTGVGATVPADLPSRKGGGVYLDVGPALHRTHQAARISYLHPRIRLGSRAVDRGASRRDPGCSRELLSVLEG